MTEELQSKFKYLNYYLHTVEKKQPLTVVELAVACDYFQNGNSRDVELLQKMQ